LPMRRGWLADANACLEIIRLGGDMCKRSHSEWL
jgi:hypothetical protein